VPAAPPERPPLLIGGAILLGAGIIALSILITFRWELAPNARIASAVRLDRWTGEIAWCIAEYDEAPASLRCGSK
jgi:hypothetical protein